MRGALSGRRHQPDGVRIICGKRGQGVDHLVQAVPPLEALRRAVDRRAVGVRVGGVAADGAAPLEIVVPQQKVPALVGGGLGAEGVEQGVELDEVQPSTRLEETGDHLRPPVQIRQIAQRPLAGVDHVEASSAERVHRVVHIGPYVVDVAVRLRREVPGRRHRRPGDVEADRARSTPGEREGLRAQMALQMRDLPPGQLAEVLPFEGGEPAERIGLLLHTVETAGQMYGSPRVPVRPVGPHHLPDHGIEPLGSLSHGAIQP